MNGTLMSVNVGMPRDVSWHGRTVHTGIWKSPVEGPARARRLNIDGDGQGDLAGHGGEQRAVFVYQLESYRYWQRQLQRDDLTPGTFGENFTVEGLADTDVHVGDRFRIGTAQFEVTQPRTTCYRVGIRLDEPEMPALLVSHHRPGFYFRVLTEGDVEAGDTIVRTYEDPRRLSVADIDALLYLPGGDIDAMRIAATITAMSPGWRQSFQGLVSAAEQPKGAEPSSPPPGWAGFTALRVVRLAPETDSVTSVYLASTVGPLPPAQPGQYLTVRVSVGGNSLVRTYSLSSAPGADLYRISVKREDHGAASTYLTSSLEVDQTIDAATPRGEFVLADGPEPVVLLSAGIGVTPVLAMLYQLVAQHSQREIWWISAARTSAQHPLAREAHTLLAQLPQAHEYCFYSSPTPGELDPSAIAGHLSHDALARLSLPTDATVYLCGPTRFMSDMQDALHTLGFAPATVRSEVFGARDAINPGVVSGFGAAPHPPSTPGDGPLVTFSRSGLSVAYDTAVRSLLDMAELCDVPSRFSCRAGVCHTCSTPLLAGQVEYTIDPLEAPAAGDVLLCCCRPSTEIVLDM